MGLFSSIFKRKGDAVVASEPVDEVHRARTRARQRLIGAVILLAIGVVGFPLVFETQPRPIPVDIPIEIPRKDGAPALVMPAARPPSPVGSVAPSAAGATGAGTPPVAPDEVITESREEAGRDGAAPLGAPSTGQGTRPPAGAATTAAAPKAGSLPTTSVPAAKSPATAAPGTAAAPRSTASTTSPASPAKPATETRPEQPSRPAGDDGARAQALLEGKPVAKPEAGRFVVQVGAFADATAAHEARLKIEKLGLKTYTQVASTPGGNRIRVRVGPFGTRDEAEKALAKARSAGLSANVLTL